MSEKGKIEIVEVYIIKKYKELFVYINFILIISNNVI